MACAFVVFTLMWHLAIWLLRGLGKKKKHIKKTRPGSRISFFVSFSDFFFFVKLGCEEKASVVDLKRYTFIHWCRLAHIHAVCMEGFMRHFKRILVAVKIVFEVHYDFIIRGADLRHPPFFFHCCCPPTLS